MTKTQHVPSKILEFSGGSEPLDQSQMTYDDLWLTALTSQTGRERAICALSIFTGTVLYLQLIFELNTENQLCYHDLRMAI